MLRSFLCLWTLAYVTCGLVCEFPCCCAAAPNIVFVLADDMGYGDLGCYGHPVAKTPRIDQLAREGVRFTQHYSNGPECSPTRTAFLTGRYQQRVGGLECAIGTGNVGRYDDAIRLADDRQLGLPAEKTVIPGRLQTAGYRCGVFGKWHLGYEPHFNPMEHSWNEFFGYLGGNVHYFNHRETSELHVLFNGRLPVYREGYMTHLITDASIDFIKRNQSKPFFLYIAHECPHFPFQGPSDAEKVVNAENWMEHDQDAYVEMLEDLDREVGRLLDALDEVGAAEDTLFVFASDNGGFAGAANMGGLNGAKGTTMEGGIRVPLIIRWPGKITPGSVSNQVCVTFDLTHSFLSACGAASDAKLDGMDIIDHVAKDKENQERTLFWRGRRGDRTWSAVRDGDWKFVRKTQGNQTEQWLFDLKADANEELNLRSTNSELATRLQQKLAAWDQEVQHAR